MQPLQWEHRPDGLRAPALICGFKGWNDASDAASSAIQFVGSALGARRFATIDPEEFYDFQATRPRVKMVDGQAREIVWPAVELYEGPTGIVGILHAACQHAGLPSASLWAAVPHYIAATPNPKAALALVRKLEGLVGVAVDASELEAAAAEYERQVNVAVQSDPDVQAFVERLEQAATSEAEDAPTSLPS